MIRSESLNLPLGKLRKISHIDETGTLKSNFSNHEDLNLSMNQAPKRFTLKEAALLELQFKL